MNELIGLEMPKISGRFSQAVEKFLETAPYLTDEHLPSIVSLQAIAEQLDGGKVTPAMLAQFGLTHRALLKANPEAAALDDEVDKIISHARAS